MHNQADPRHHTCSRTNAESNGVDDAVHKGMDPNAFQRDDTESQLGLLRPVFDEFVAELPQDVAKLSATIAIAKNKIFFIVLIKF